MTEPPSKEQQTWSDFARAYVRVELAEHPVTVRPAAVRSGVFPTVFGAGPVHVITAWNPGGKRAEPVANDAAQAALAAEIDALAVEQWPAVGFDPTDDWHEDSVAVVGISRAEACALGRRYGQAAIFEWVDADDGLRVVACDGTVVSAFAWALV